MTDDERTQLIRERDAAWERDRLFAADGGLIGDTRYLLQRLDAVTAERDAYRAAIAEHNEYVLTTDRDAGFITVNGEVVR